MCLYKYMILQIVIAIILMDHLQEIVTMKESAPAEQDLLAISVENALQDIMGIPVKVKYFKLM